MYVLVRGGKFLSKNKYRQVWDLDSIYQKYVNKVNRNVEGFVVNYQNIISKYVRMKSGKLREHFDRGE
mgnify:CR=1 FL=1